ncbi:uncharacterized protein [Bactrocera oleae]|uniref:uncharacterized protein n=3 Tax=Bactrocera oleae TaxID=104688 RepID=UPI00387E4D07
MDVEDIHSAPKTVRSVIAAPRASGPPIAAPRMQSATAPHSQSSAAAVRDANEEQFDEHLPPRCSLCHRPHVLKRCTIFKSMKPAQRQQIARAHGHCMTCLADSHSTFECITDGSCQYCQRPHHTLFHRFPRRANPSTTQTSHRHRQQGNPVQRQRIHRPKPSRGARSRPPPPPYGHRNQRQRATGLNAVVSTLQQLQRLLGNAI